MKLRCVTVTCYLKDIEVEVPRGTVCLACDQELKSLLDGLFGDVQNSGISDLFGTTFG